MIGWSASSPTLEDNGTACSVCCLQESRGEKGVKKAIRNSQHGFMEGETMPDQSSSLLRYHDSL